MNTTSRRFWRPWWALADGLFWSEIGMAFLILAVLLATVLL